MRGRFTEASLSGHPAHQTGTPHDRLEPVPDRLTREQRSRLMARVRTRDTAPEVALRRRCGRPVFAAGDSTARFPASPTSSGVAPRRGLRRRRVLARPPRLLPRPVGRVLGREDRPQPRTRRAGRTRARRGGLAVVRSGTSRSSAIRTRAYGRSERRSWPLPDAVRRRPTSFPASVVAAPLTLIDLSPAAAG